MDGPKAGVMDLTEVDGRISGEQFAGKSMDMIVSIQDAEDQRVLDFISAPLPKGDPIFLEEFVPRTGILTRYGKKILNDAKALYGKLTPEPTTAHETARYPCGFPSFDASMSGGFQPGHLVVVLANPGEYEPLLDSIMRWNWLRRSRVMVHRCPEPANNGPGEKARTLSGWMRNLCGRVSQNGDLNLVLNPTERRERFYSVDPDGTNVEVIPAGGGNVLSFYASVLIQADTDNLTPGRIRYHIKKNRQFTAVGHGIGMNPRIVVGWGPLAPMEYASQE